MRGSLLALLAVAAFPTSAAAAPVLVLGHDGRARAIDDPYVLGPAVTPVPQRFPHLARARAASKPPQRRRTVSSDLARAAGKHARRHRPTVISELARLYRHHEISAAAYHSYKTSFIRALTSEKRLKGTRRTELAAVTETMHQIAASRKLTPSRLPALFLTLNGNRQWWTSGPLLAAGQRVEFPGSQLVWEYYPGQGIQLQVLGTFSKADALYTAGASEYGQLEKLLGQMIPLAAKRAGGLTWEYYFHFDGGRPPWTSAMSQATGLEALTRAYQATGNQYYLDIATQALAVFKAAPPSGVTVRTPLGNRYVQYTFTPGTSIINAFLQTLIGLYDYAKVSGNREAVHLFNAGNAEATAEVPHFDTGAWSLYQPGVEDDLSYHELVTGFLAQLCSRTSLPVYCATAKHFRTYLKTPPTLQQLTFSAKARRPINLRFRLSKISHVGVVITQGTTVMFETSATLPYGADRFTIPALKRPGTYAVRLAATDLAGNFARITGALQISG
jgi:D-glucuronyl C5-epimerase C-terminus